MITAERFKVICSDIDGTLLDEQRSLSSATVNTIKRLKDSTQVILASSRMPSAMRYLQEKLDITDMPLVCYNGAYVLTGEQEVIVSAYVPIEVLESIVELDLHEGCNVSVYSEDRWYVEQDDEWTLREIANTTVRPFYSPLRETIAQLNSEFKSAHKIMCMGEKEVIDAIFAALRTYADVLNLYRSKDTYLEISSKAMNKASAVQELLMLHSPAIEWSDVISFGDNYNDIEMLRASGLGVAMGNAKPEVLEMADVITERNIEDGVAKELQRRFSDRPGLYSETNSGVNT